MKQNINDKYILCSKCGQVGRGLLKIDDLYVCAEEDLCKNRTRRKKPNSRVAEGVALTGWRLHQWLDY